MAELIINENTDVGIKKEIDEGAIELVFQAIQEDIYAFPIQSFVRETISNALDAVTERNIAIDIHDGDPVDKYYLQRQDGKLLKDSAFDPEYAKKEFLAKLNFIDVEYLEKDGRDSISVRDFGVGLGGSRLKGFFKIGYSSKRNMPAAIGKFGAGAKAGLATGVEYFEVITTYEGYKTSFQVFKTDYDPITPKHKNGREEDWKVMMANGKVETRTIYWEPTDDFNGVQVILDVKKHNKKAFIDAVKNQFQYFKGRVHFKYPVTDYSNNTTIKTDKMEDNAFYESNNLIIPKYSTYNSPHILVDGISYGPISWQELELERRSGKIAIKVSATDVDITQSRENLKWTDKTKKTVLEKIKLARYEASEHITSALAVLDDENIFELNTKYGVLRKSSENEISHVFSTFLDMSSIKPKYKLNIPGCSYSKTHTMDDKLFEFLFYRHSVWQIGLRTDGQKVRIQKTKVSSLDSLKNMKIIFSDDTQLGPKRVQHIMTSMDVGSFIYIRSGSARTKLSISVQENGLEVPSGKVEEFTTGLIKKYGDMILDDIAWDEIDDPEDEMEKVVENNSNAAAIARRKEKKVLYTFFDATLQTTYRWSGSHEGNRNRSSSEIKIEELEDDNSTWFDDYKDVVVCTQKFKDLGRLIETSQYHMKKNSCLVIFVAEPVVKHFLKHPKTIHVTEYFRKLNPKTGELMIGEAVRDLNTLNKMAEIAERAIVGQVAQQYGPLESLCSDDFDIELYKTLMKRKKSETWKDVISKSWGFDAVLIADITKYLESLNEFQNIVKTGDAANIAKKSVELFGSDAVHSIDAYDEEFVSKVEVELDTIGLVGPIVAYFDRDNTLCEASTKLLKELIKLKLSQQC